jgi:transposase
MLPASEPVITVTPAQRAQVEAALRQRDLPPRVRERLEMVKAASLGHDLETIAVWSGRTPRTVRRWLVRFTRGGITALVDAPRAGRPARATAAYQAALTAAAETSPRALGLGFDVWTSARLSAYLAETTGVQIAPGWVRTLLRQQRFRAGRPKHTLRHLRDPDEVAHCEAELRVAGEKSASPAGQV